ncbi:MAG: hypothetical protein IJR63_08160 [Synergistaceae bacterium]|nr:hypothetical protein [Synergistaceae bacterium]
MNCWTEKSIEFAVQRNYLDELFKVYPLSPNLRRELSREQVDAVRLAYDARDNLKLVETLLDTELFPLKDSYIPFLRHDRGALVRNPQTVNRIAGNLYHMGFEAIIEKCTAPKETNRQMGPMFKNWIARGVIGVPVLNDPEEFLHTQGNCILSSTDSVMQDFSREFLGFTRSKGVDFLARSGGKYVVGEAKLLTDFGGHQNAQFDDALSTLHSFTASEFHVIPVAIIDGVIYIRNHSKIHDYLQHHPEDNIMSALVLREFLYSL